MEIKYIIKIESFLIENLTNNAKTGVSFGVLVVAAMKKY